LLISEDAHVGADALVRVAERKLGRIRVRGAFATLPGRTIFADLEQFG